MSEARHRVDVDAPVLFRHRRHALLLFPSPAPRAPLGDSHEVDAPPVGVAAALRLAFSDEAPSHDGIFEALLGAGPLSGVGSFVYMSREGSGVRLFARGPLRVEELPGAPRVGVHAAVVEPGDAVTWVEVLLPHATGVEIMVADARIDVDRVPIQLRFGEHDEPAFERLGPTAGLAETTVDPDLDEGFVDETVLGAQSTAGKATQDPTAVGSQIAEATIIGFTEDGQASPVHEAPAPEEDRVDESLAAFPNRRAETYPVPVLEEADHHEPVGEHDGRTVLSEEASRIRQAASSRSAVAQDSGEHDGLTVAGRGFRGRRDAVVDDTVLTPARASHERRAADARHSIPPQPAPPSPYVIELAMGGVIDLAGPIVFGRAPSMSGEQTGGVQPRHLKLDGATDISRNHVLLSVEGGVIVVTDLHSRNGTDVLMPGRGPQRLRAGEPTAVVSGTVVDLGSGQSFTVRARP